MRPRFVKFCRRMCFYLPFLGAVWDELEALLSYMEIWDEMG